MQAQFASMAALESTYNERVSYRQSGLAVLRTTKFGMRRRTQKRVFATPAQLACWVQQRAKAVSEISEIKEQFVRDITVDVPAEFRDEFDAASQEVMDRHFPDGDGLKVVYTSRMRELFTQSVMDEYRGFALDRQAPTW
jgi:hypothetical protein